MGKRRTAEQIPRLLREAQRDLAEGLTVSDVCRKLGVSQNAYYRPRSMMPAVCASCRSRSGGGSDWWPS